MYNYHAWALVSTTTTESIIGWKGTVVMACLVDPRLVLFAQLSSLSLWRLRPLLLQLETYIKWLIKDCSNDHSLPIMAATNYNFDDYSWCKLIVAWSPFVANISTRLINLHNVNGFRCHYWQLSCSCVHSYGRNGLVGLVYSVYILSDQLQTTRCWHCALCGMLLW